MQYCQQCVKICTSFKKIRKFDTRSSSGQQILAFKESLSDDDLRDIKKAKIKLNKFIVEAATKSSNIKLIGEYIKEIDNAKKTLVEVSSPKYIKQVIENWESEPISTKNLIIKVHTNSILVFDHAEFQIS